MPTIDEKLAQLRQTGIGEDVIARMLTLPEKVKEEAAQLGLSFKEIQDDEVTLLADTGNLDDADVIEVNGRTFKAFGPPKKKAPADAAADPMMADTEPDPNDPNEPAEIAAGEAPEDGTEMGDEAVTDMDLSAIADAIGPIVAQHVLATLGPALDLEQRLMKALDTAKTAVGQAVGTKETESLPYLQMVQQQPQVNQGLIDALTAIAGEVNSLKSKTTDADTKTSAAAKEIDTLKATIADAQARLKALEGDVPAGIQPMLAGYRASQDGATVTHKALTGPQDVQQPPPESHTPFINDFISSVLSGKPLA